MCGKNRKKYVLLVLQLLIMLSMFSIVCSHVNSESIESVTIYTDVKDDVIYYDFNIDKSKTTSGKPWIDFKEVDLWNNDTTFFMRFIFHGNVKDSNNVIYECWVSTYNIEGPSNTGPYYKNGKGFWNETPIDTYKEGNTLLFEIPIEYLEMDKCVWNGSELRLNPYAEELSDYGYHDMVPVGKHRLYNYREREGYPRAYIEYITPEPGYLVEDRDIINISGYGVAVNNNIIIDYEWKLKRISSGSTIVTIDSSFFTISNLSEGGHLLFFRVKDSEGNWSDYVVEELCVYSKYSPVLEILSPKENEMVSGDVEIRFTIFLPDPNHSLYVKMSIDHIGWLDTIYSTPNPNATDEYVYIWDSTKMDNGYHVISLSAESGLYNSNVDSVTVYVNNTGVTPGNHDNGENAGILNQLQQNKTLITILLITAILIGLIMVKMKKKKNMIGKGIEKQIGR